MNRRSATRLSKSCILIIVIASVERFTYKGVSSNLVTYLTEVVRMSTSSAARSVSTWSGANFMLPLLSALLTDSFWDRYSVITASSLIYVVGLIGLTSWALLQAWMPCSSLFLPLYLISIGQGGYNPSLQAFGADQLQMDNDNDDSIYESEEEKAKVKSQFFQWWYFGICSGSLLGNSIMSYVQDTIGWGLGFAIPSAVMALSITSFLCGASLYVHKQNKAHKSFPLENVVRFVKEVVSSIIARKGWLPIRAHDDDNDHEGVSVELELQTKTLNDISSMKEEKLEELSPSVTKTIARLLPIWTMLLMFAVIFQQPLTFFTKQGMWMHHGIGSFVIPPAMLQSTITISIILLMPFYDKMLIPLLRVITREKKGITVLQRIGIGMLFSIIAMFIAALVESKRLHESREKGKNLMIVWLLPQYVLLGISDVFTVVGMNEFFYNEVPSTMRTVGIALYSSVFGFGSFLGAFLIDILEVATVKGGGKKGSWFSDDPGEARLDNYYLFLAILSCISFIGFTFLSRYHYSCTT